jgi:hypothetical protein
MKDVSIGDNLFVVSSSLITYVLLGEGKTILTGSSFIIIRFSFSEKLSTSNSEVFCMRG